MTHASLAASRPQGRTPAQRVLRWLATERPWLDTEQRSQLEPPAFTTRLAYSHRRGQGSWIVDVDDVRAALEQLERDGWINRLPRVRGVPGRPSERWTPHPNLTNTEGDTR